jgi:hypothetical protein
VNRSRKTRTDALESVPEFHRIPRCDREAISCEASTAFRRRLLVMSIMKDFDLPCELCDNLVDPLFPEKIVASFSIGGVP